MNKARLTKQELLDQIDSLQYELEKTKSELKSLRAKSALSADDVIHSTISNSQDIFFAKDRDGIFTHCSSSLAKILNCEPSDLIGKKNFDIFPEKFAKVYDEEERQVLETGRSLIVIHDVVSPDGKSIILETAKSPVFDSNGQVTGLVGVSQDVTEREQNRRLHEENNQNLNDMFDAMGDFLLIISHQGELQHVNKAFLKHFGYTAGEVREKGLLGIHHRDDIVGTEAQLAKILSGESTVCKSKIISADGSQVNVETRFTPFRHNGKDAFFGICRDISEQTQREARLRKQRNTLWELSDLSNLPDVLNLIMNRAIEFSGMDSGGIYLVDDKGGLELQCYTGLSAQFAKIAQYHDPDSPSTKMVLQGDSVFRLYDKINLPLSPDKLKEGLKAIAVIPIKHRGKVIACMNVSSHTEEDITDQQKVILETFAAQVGSAVARAQSEAELYTERDNLRSVFNAVPVGLLIINGETQISAVNDPILKLFNKTREEVLLQQPGDALQCIYSFQNNGNCGNMDVCLSCPLRVTAERVLELREPFFNQTINPVFVIDGVETPVWVDFSAIPITMNGKKSALIAIQNITELKHAQDALALSEERYRTIAEITSDYITISHVDAAGKISPVLITDTIQNVTGYSADEYIAHGGIRSIIHPDDQESYNQFIRDFSPGKEVEKEFRIVHKSGETVWLHTVSKSIPNPDNIKEQTVYVAANDITDRKRAQHALSLSENRFRTTMKNAPLTVAHCDTELRYTWILNPHSNYEDSEVLGKRDDEIGQGEGIRQLMAMKKLVLKTGHGSREIVTFDHLPVSATFDITAEPLEDSNGNIIGVTTAALDITQQIRVYENMRENEARLRQLTEHVDMVFWLRDHERMLYVRLPEFALSGLTEEDMYQDPYAYFNVIHEADLPMVKEIVLGDEYARTGDFDFECRVKSKEKLLRWFSFHSYGIRDNQGKLIRTAGFARDITESKKMELARVTLVEMSNRLDGYDESELLRFCLEKSVEITQSEIGYLHFVNPDQETISLQMWSADTMSLCEVPTKISHYPISEAGVWVDCIHQRKPVIHNDYASLPHKKGLPDGHAPVIRDVGVPVFEEGKIVAVIGVGNRPDDYSQIHCDVLQMLADNLWSLVRRRRAEDQRNETRRQLQSLLANLPGMAYRCSNDHDWTMSFVSPGAEKLTGYPPEAIENNNLIPYNEIIHPDDREMVWETVQRGIEENGTYQLTYRIISRNQEIKSVWEAGLAVYDASGEMIALEGFIMDISARIKAEEKLGLSESRLNVLFNSMNQGILQLNAKEQIIAFNPTAGEILGLKKEHVPFELHDWLGRQEDGKPMPRENYPWHLALRSGQPVTNTIAGVADPSGKGLRWLSIDAVPQLKRGEEKPFEVFVIINDITERFESQLEMKKLLAAIEQAGEMIVISDKAGKIIYTNPAYERITGWTLSQLQSRDANMFHNPDPKLHTQFAMAYAKVSRGQIWTGTLERRRSNGTIYQESAVISPVLDENKEIINYIAVRRDISDQVSLEQQLRQSQKMEAIGRLAGGVAHDFNNLLTVITGYCDLLAEPAKADPLFEEGITQIQTASERAASLTNQLLAFSRKQVIQPKLMDMNQVLGDSMKMFSRLIGEDIRIKMDLCSSSAPISADPGQFNQVLVNLLVNAQYAISVNPNAAVKKIVISTRMLAAKDVSAENRTDLSAGSKVVLSFSDTGIGMDEEIISKIFDPFFTTKKQGEGTGLGLSTVYGIVRQNNGFIYAESEPGNGATFTIYWPVAGTVPGSGRDSRPAPVLLSGKETILIVEDDTIVRNVARISLAKLGYTVIQAENGEQALALLDKTKPNIALLMTDIVMPGISGVELAHKVRESRPELPILFTSGYANTDFNPEEFDPKLARFIPKPFSITILSKSIRELIDQS